MTGGNGSGGGDVWGGALRVREAALRTARGGGGGADALLAALSGVVAHDHASLTRWDPLRRRHVTLASTYPDGANAYIERRLHEDAGFASVRRSPAGARWWHDVPDHERRLSPGWRDTLEPLGVRDGVAQCLFAADGRYVGMLNASATRGGRGDHGAARAAVALLGDCLAAAVDPLRPGTPGDAGPGAGERAAGAPGTVLVPDDPDAAPVPLDGERPVGFASADSPLAGAVRRAARRRPGPARLLVPYGGRLYELRLARRPSATAVVCRTVARPSALTARELEVLAELAEGRTNPEIAERLCVARRTVATHVEHILVKLGVPNRVAAAARAVAWGLEPAP